MSKSEYFMRELLGQAPDFPQDLIAKCARAQLIIAGADGLSPQEEEDCHGIGRLMGATEETVRESKAFDYKKAKLEDNLPPEVRPFGRLFIYMAIKVASAAAGYSKQERASVANAANLLGIDQPTLHAIEGLVEAEQGLRAARIAVCAPR